MTPAPNDDDQDGHPDVPAAAEHHALAFTRATRGIVVSDPASGLVTAVNPAFAAMHGGAAADFVGRPYATLLTPRFAERQPQLDAFADRAGLVTYEADHARLDGSVLPVHVETVVEHDDAGVARSRLSYVDDLTGDRAQDRTRHTVRERLRTAFADAPVGMAVLEDGRFVEVNGALCAMVGRGAEELRLMTRRDLTHPDDSVEAPEKRYVRGDGSTLWVRVHAATVASRPGATRTSLVHVVDITAERRAREERDQVSAQFEEAFAHAPIGMALVAPDGAWLKVNAAVCDLLQLSESELLRRTFQEVTHPDDLDSDLEYVRQLLAGERTRYEMEKRYLVGDGRVIWVQLSVSLVRDADGEPLHFISQIQDISERKRMESQLVYLADHDALTDLYNRRRFESELEQQVERARRYGEPSALLLIDLDNFKYVNDTYGHSAGDRLIRHVARLLTDRLRRTDVVARIGGDEFAVLLTHVSAPRVAAIAAELVATFAAAPLDLHGSAVHVTASIGVAVVDSRTQSAEEALVRADLAMYDAKHTGRNRASHYAEALNERVSGGMAWSQRLRHAIDHERFVVHAQPIVDMRTGGAVWEELLVRMIGEDGELVMPDRFLYVAERFGMVPEVDRLVLRRAVGLLAGREDDCGLSVNLGAKSLEDPRLPEHVAGLLDRHGVAGERLMFEITEQAAVANLHVAARVTERLKGLGCQIAVDDFGSGFGGFSYLKHLPVDLLKIDGSFVQEVATNRTDQLVVGAVVGVMEGLGKAVVAERVADERTREALIAHGVTLGQGYLFGRPEPAGAA